MFIVKLVRLIRGYVIFCACGGFNEKFVNVCVEKGVSLWDIFIKNGTITAKVFTSDYIKLRHIARESGAKIEIRKKNGLPFFIRKHRKRVGLAVGACMFSLVLYVLSTMIWTVNVEGNVKLYDENVIDILEAMNVKPGVLKSRINTDAVEQEIAVILEKDIYWASLNIEGSCAKLEVRELPDIEMRQSFGAPCNVVADFDGVIVGMSVLSGKPAVKVGSAVRSGDLLISGAIENKDLTTSLYEAFGDTVAMRTRNIQTDISGLTVKQISPFKQVYYIYFFGINIPMGSIDKEQSFCDRQSLKIGAVELPLGLSKYLACGFDEIQLTKEQSQLVTLEKFFSESGKQLQSTAIISQTVSWNDQKIDYVAQCLDYIGIQKAIVTEDIRDISE